MRRMEQPQKMSKTMRLTRLRMLLKVADSFTPDVSTKVNVRQTTAAITSKYGRPGTRLEKTG